MRDGKHRQFEARRDSRLVEGIREVPFDGFFAQPELFRDVAVAAALDDAADYLHFARGKAEGLTLRNSCLFHQIMQCADQIHDAPAADPVIAGDNCTDRTREMVGQGRLSARCLERRFATLR